MARLTVTVLDDGTGSVSVEDASDEAFVAMVAAAVLALDDAGLLERLPVHLPAINIRGLTGERASLTRTIDSN